MIYVQRDFRWSGKTLGVNSPYTMGGYGCFVTSIANVMLLSGRLTTPGEICDALIANNGFADGLAVWANVTQAFPFFRFDGGPYKIAQGYNAATAGSHWWAVSPTGSIVDPWTGNATHPAGYPATGYANGVSCDPLPISINTASVTIPVQGQSGAFLLDLSPSQDFSMDVVAMQHFLTRVGMFVDAGSQDGYYGPKTQKAVHNYQVSKGLTATLQYGWWYPLTRAFANQDLLITNNA